jgi:hypothetical protein
MGKSSFANLKATALCESAERGIPFSKPALLVSDPAILDENITGLWIFTNL